MKRTQRTEIVVEKERTLLISRCRRTREEAWCDVCGAEVEMIDTWQAAVAVGVSQLTIFRLIDAGALHYAETNGGTLLVCASSLAVRLRVNDLTQ